MPFRLMLIIMFATAGTATAQMTCTGVAPRIMENSLRPATGETSCPQETTAYYAELAVERACYDTGMTEETTDLHEQLFKPRTVRVRRGGEVIEKVVPAQPTLRKVFDVSKALDAVNFHISGVICAGADRSDFLSGRWRVFGRDSGRVYSAEGYFPTEVIWTELDLGAEPGLLIGIDLPPVTLSGDAEARKIDAQVRIPLE